MNGKSEKTKNTVRPSRIVRTPFSFFLTKRKVLREWLGEKKKKQQRATKGKKIYQFVTYRVDLFYFIFNF